MGKKQNLKGITLDGKPLDPDDFIDPVQDNEIKKVRQEDSYKPLYKTIKEKQKHRKRRSGKVRQYTPEEVSFINDTKPVNYNTDIFGIISILKIHGSLTKEEILSYNTISGKNFSQSIHKVYTGLSIQGYIGRKKVKNPNATSKKNSKVFSYYLTEEGLRFSPEVLTKMAYYYFNDFKNRRRKQLQEERKNQKLENNFIKEEENKDQNEDQENTNEKENSDININININIHITLS